MRLLKCVQKNSKLTNYGYTMVNLAGQFILTDFIGVGIRIEHCAPNKPKLCYQRPSPGARQ